MIRFILTIMIALTLASFPTFALMAEDEVVDVELVLAVDVSMSIQDFELDIQRKGYASAITSPEVMHAISQGLHGKIAVTYFEWAGSNNHVSIVPWTVIETPEDASRFAHTLLESPSNGMRRTSISGAIDHAARLFNDNGIKGLKRVIDISGDGPNNQGRPVLEARNDAISSGIVINGLPLITLDSSPFGAYDLTDLDLYYADCVIGGPGAFLVPVDSWEQFPVAVRRKLVLELARSEAQARIVPVSRASPYDCLVGEKMWNERFYQFDEN